MSKQDGNILMLQLQGTGVKVSIGFPADMATESYKQEELIKVGPSEFCTTVSISASV